MPVELIAVAAAFVDLQQARHEAVLACVEPLRLRSRLPLVGEGILDVEVSDMREVVYVACHQRESIDKRSCRDDRIRQPHATLLAQPDRAGCNRVIERQYQHGGECRLEPVTLVR
jgi:hypothetical protein